MTMIILGFLGFILILFVIAMAYSFGYMRAQKDYLEQSIQNQTNINSIASYLQTLEDNNSDKNKPTINVKQQR